MKIEIRHWEKEQNRSVGSPAVTEIDLPVIAFAKPLERIAKALGPDCVAELRKARPEPPADTGFIRDRFIVNPVAVGYWLYWHFNLDIFVLDDDAIEVDPLGEIIVVQGKEYRLPHWCYSSMGPALGEPGDRRPGYQAGNGGLPPGSGLNNQ